MILEIEAPITSHLPNVEVGQMVEVSGIVYTARDAILPKIARHIKEGSIKSFPVDLRGAAILHTAYSPSGFGPTSSNKEEIETTMGILSQAGVRLHIGKGFIKQQTVEDISQFGAMYIVVPPVSALLQTRLTSARVVAFEEEGMEAMHELKVRGLPGIIAAAKGMSIFQC